MARCEILTLIAVSVLAGVKSTYGLELWRGKESSVFLVWSMKQMYIMAGIGLLFYGLIWGMSGKSILTVRIVDLLSTYGILALVDGKQKVVPNGILA